jgi:hypothetical protein
MEDNLIQALEAALADTEEFLTQSESHMRALVAAIEHLRLERQGLLLALARHRNGIPFDERHPDVDGTPNEWLELTRTDAIERVLTMAGGRALSPTEVTEHLTKVGRSDAVHHVGAALSYLNSRKRVRSLGRGRWTSVTDDGLSTVNDEEQRVGDTLSSHTNGFGPSADDAPDPAAPADHQEDGLVNR